MKEIIKQRHPTRRPSFWCAVMLAFSFISALSPISPAAEEIAEKAGEKPTDLTIIVMDPLSAPLSCPCVEGYAQRDYEQLADFIEKKTGLTSKVVFNESLVVAFKGKAAGQASLVIGKDSVVRSDALRAKLKLKAVARLTGKDGTTTQTGLIIVRADDPAKKLSDLQGYRFLFGPTNCSEKYDAARKLLTDAGVDLPENPEISSACSDGACKIIEWGSDVRAATVISSYAKPLLEGCGTIEKGDLRVIAETKPVPFVTAFVNADLPVALQKQLGEVLLDVKTDKDMRAALETLLGFEEVETKEIKAAKPAIKEKTAAKAAASTSYITPAIPTNDSWPGWRGKQRDGHCGWLPAELPEQLKIVWRQPLSGPGLAGVAANQRYVILGDRDLNDESDEFRCYSVVDGKEQWVVRYKAPGHLDYGNTPRATPLIHGDFVYLHGAFGDISCVQIDSGLVLWTKNYKKDFGATAELPWGTCGSPLIADEKLIIYPGAPDAAIVALDLLSGMVLWKTPGDAPAYGSFIAGELGGVPQIVGHDANSLAGWDLATGKLHWDLVPPSKEDFSVPTPLIVNGKLLVSSENNGTRLFDFTDDGKIIPEPIAQNEDFASDTATLLAIDDRVYGVWGELYCMNFGDGLKTSWTGRDDSFLAFGSLIAHGQRLLVCGASGELLLLDTKADKFEVVSRLTVFDNRKAELYSHPAMVGSRLYLRGERELVCVELDSKSIED